MQLHLDEIARTVAKGAHAVLLLDRAGWHTTRALAIPKNITMILLPLVPRSWNPGREHLCSTFARTNSPTASLETYDAITDACDAGASSCASR
jgi:hypothetical protein